MGRIFALMVGINEYRDPSVPSLRGCHTDIDRAIAFLEQRRDPATDLRIRRLFDDEATGVAIVDGFRTHLAQARGGDTALFWFSGHGSTAPVPPDFWHLEPNGRDLQTLVCFDSRYGGRPDLLDKELALLLDEVADGGCHVVSVLDSCHSGGATRGPEVRARAVRPAAVPAAHVLLPDLAARYADGPPAVRHVLLAACQPAEVAAEEDIGGEPCGLFSWALLRAMHRAGPDTTYRELVTLARNEVERLSMSQRPLVFPAGPGSADQRLLGGGSISVPPAITMRCGRDGWEIDAGSCHGVEPGPVQDPTRVAVAGRTPVQEARLTSVGVNGSRVDPIGWTPDPQRGYPVVISQVAMPPTTVVIDDDVDPSIAERIRKAVGTAGPDGGPSPEVRLVEGADAELAICAAQPVAYRSEVIRIADRDRVRLWDQPIDGDGSQVAKVLTHIARWRRVKNLQNPVSGLTGAVSLEIVEPWPHETVVPKGRAAVRPDPDGMIRLSYRWQHGEWVPPTRFMRLRNTTQRPLYCVLLDLTDRFGISAELFRGARIEAGSAAAVAEGRHIEFTLPPARTVEPGASVRDWIMLIVARDEIAATPYELPPLSAPDRDAVHRDLKPARPAQAANANDWWTYVLPVITEVPEPSQSH